MNDLLLQILMPLAGAVGGGGIVELLHWRSNKRKAAAEATKAEAEAGDTRIDAMSKLVDQMQEQEDKYIALINDKDARIESVLQDNIALKSEATSAELLMCVNLGCPLRKPVQGQGKKWYEAHSDSPDIGANYTPINVLLKMYGDRKKRMIQEAGEDNGQDENTD
jgi:hypothetical protein